MLWLRAVSVLLIIGTACRAFFRADLGAIACNASVALRLSRVGGGDLVEHSVPFSEAKTKI
ncbi:MAG: hypothetical protein J6M27_10305 [Lachnospiraceae bacterium]|nr:hypothetical protein [Lachnospiraceae bacterium]